MFEIKLVTPSVTYYEALGICEQRANELMEKSRELILDYTDVSEVMRRAAEECESIEELIFIQFKIGEILGIIRASKAPNEARQFVTELQVKAMLKRIIKSQEVE